MVRLLEEIERREAEVGGAAVALGWVKSHIWIKGNKKADEMAKAGATITAQVLQVTEGGVGKKSRSGGGR